MNHVNSVWWSADILCRSVTLTIRHHSSLTLLSQPRSGRERGTYNVNVIRDDSQSALHCFPTQIQMSRPLFSGRRRHGNETRESMSVNDHLDQMLQLLVSARMNDKKGTYTMQSLGLGDPDWIPRVCSFGIIVPVSRK